MDSDSPLRHARTEGRLNLSDSDSDSPASPALEEKQELRLSLALDGSIEISSDTDNGDYY